MAEPTDTPTPQPEGLSEALARLHQDLDTHDSGGLAHAAADCESIALVRADDLRIVLAHSQPGGELREKAIKRLFAAAGHLVEYGRVQGYLKGKPIDPKDGGGAPIDCVTPEDIRCLHEALVGLSALTTLPREEGGGDEPRTHS